jgi:hypothetical protein
MICSSPSDHSRANWAGAAKPLHSAKDVSRWQRSDGKPCKHDPRCQHAKSRPNDLTTPDIQTPYMPDNRHNLTGFPGQTGLGRLPCEPRQAGGTSRWGRQSVDNVEGGRPELSGKLHAGRRRHGHPQFRRLSTFASCAQVKAAVCNKLKSGPLVVLPVEADQAVFVLLVWIYSRTDAIHDPIWVVSA